MPSLFGTEKDEELLANQPEHPSYIKEWLKRNTFHHSRFSDVKKLVAKKNALGHSISLCFPTLNEEKTIGKEIETMRRELVDKYPLIDEIVVVDSGSTDKTKEISKKAGAEFFYSSDILPQYRAYRGKGENLWKSLHILKGDIICWIDADITNIHPRFVLGLIGPLLEFPHISYVKAFYKRPIRIGEHLVPLGGGRVTELTIRPLFNMYFPRLSGFIQPLSGEYAMRRSVAEKIPFFSGYAVETATIIDIVKKFGLRKCAQVDLKRRIHRNQSLTSLHESFPDTPSVPKSGIYRNKDSQNSPYFSITEIEPDKAIYFPGETISVSNRFNSSQTGPLAIIS